MPTKTKFVMLTELTVQTILLTYPNYIRRGGNVIFDEPVHFQLQNGQQEKQENHLFGAFAAAFGDSLVLDSFGVSELEAAGCGDSSFVSCFAFSGSPPLNEMLFPPSPVNLKFREQNIDIFIDLQLL